MAKLVEAVGVASGSINPDNKARAKRIEAAMSQAVLDCYAVGITDPAKVKEAMMAAREKAKSA